jgi:hypothetical protein
MRRSGELWLEATWIKSYQDPISISKLGVVFHACHPSYVGGINRRISVQVSQDKNMRPYGKQLKHRG